MENQKNNKGVITLLIVIIVILSALCVLFATGTISFNSNKVNDNDINENINDNNQVDDNTNDDSNTVNMQNMVGEYNGKDPWDYDLTVIINSISNNDINLVISNEYYKKEVSTKLINDTAAFHIQGISEDNRYEVNYSVALSLTDNGISIKFVSGYLTSISSSGNASFANVGPLNESEKTVILKKIA